MDCRHHVGGTDFVWDLAKADENRRKHSVTFEDAATVFADPLIVLLEASRNDEARNAVVGFDQQARLLFVVHVEFENECIRIISARLASSLEEETYAQ